MSEALGAGPGYHPDDSAHAPAAGRRAAGLRMGETPVGERATLTALALALALALAAAPALAAPAVAASPQMQHRLGIQTLTLKAQRRSAEVNAFAKVLDPGPLAALESDLDTAIAASDASAAEARRARALSPGNAAMSAKDAEAAISQARQDVTKVAFLRRRVGLEWGPGLQRLSDARRQALVQALSRGKAALVQVDTPGSQGQAGARTVEIDIGSGSVRAPVLGPSRTAEGRLQSSGLIALVTGPQAILFSVGLTQSARIDQASSQLGVLLPRAALIRHQGSDWAYVQTAPSRFERRLAQDPVPEKDGDFVAQGFRPGEVVAVGGAAALFAAEQGGAR